MDNGHPTTRDRQQLHQADSGAPSWPLHVGDFGASLWVQAGYEKAQFPFWVIEPELLDDVRDVEHHPGSAVFRAARRLEMILRAFDPALAELMGQDLVNRALGEGRPFEPRGAHASERQAWAHLFRGVVGAIRNPEGHRDQQLTIEDAIGQILTVNLLLRKLKADFPERFQQKRKKRRVMKWFEARPMPLLSGVDILNINLLAVSSKLMGLRMIIVR